MMTPVELSAARRFFFLSPAEIAAEIGRSGEEWESYEAGLRPVPENLIRPLLSRLRHRRAETAIACMDKMMVHDQGNHIRIILLWYQRREDMPGDPTTVEWRLYQSVCAEHIATSDHAFHPLVILFDVADYAAWLRQRGEGDTVSGRMEWARECASMIYATSVGGQLQAHSPLKVHLHPRKRHYAVHRRSVKNSLRHIFGKSRLGGSMLCGSPG